MELGMAAADAENEAVKPLFEGMELTLKMFQSVLEKMGVTVVNPENEAFNPEFHQAMSMQETTDAEPNTVLAVMQKGYVLNERLVRPAMVVVSKAPAA
jgi:molecular chaperone GrpE